MTSIPVWQTALWFTMVLVLVSFFFQIISRNKIVDESSHFEELANNNKLLATQLALLQHEIVNLNKELKHLTAENHTLNQEVQFLTKEVARIRSSMSQTE